MQKTTNIKEVGKGRLPSDTEARAIFRWMNAEFVPLRNKSALIAILTSAIGGSMIGIGFTRKEPLLALLMFAAGTAIYNITWTNIKNAMTLINLLGTFRKGRYLVFDGWIGSLTEDDDYDDIVHITFQAPTGICLDKEFFVEKEGANLGAPLKMVFVPGAASGNSFDFVNAYTQHMLYESGVKTE